MAGRKTGDFERAAKSGRRKEIMKKCNHCGAELAQEETVCPSCGQPVAEETAAEETAAPAGAAGPGQAAPEQGEAESFTCEEESAQGENPENAEQTPETPAEPEKKKPSVWIWVVGALAVIAIVAAILIAGKKDTAQSPADAADPTVTETESDEETAPSDLVSYTAAEEQLTDDVLALPIATCGGKVMTNKELDFFYWQQYYTFASNYSAYLSYILDQTKGLDEQMYSADETWQQALLAGAADMFHSITALNLGADAEGFELSEEDQAELDALPENLNATAAYYGMEDGTAYLQASFGPTATMEDYVAFARDNLRASRYMQKLVEELSFTDQQISDYYDQNADTYAESHVEKIDKPMVDVRHILVIPAEQDENGEYTEAAWQQAEQKAEAILNEWRSGEATEDSFAALADENSEDPGSNTNGGLYEAVYPGQMVDEFDAWCFDDARQPGDTGIVKTSYGYHIMYFVGHGEEIFWFETAKGDLRSEKSVEIEDSLREKYPMETTFENAAIYDVLKESREAAIAAQQAQAEAEAQTSEDSTQEASSETDTAQQSASN